MIKILKKSMLFHVPSPAYQVMESIQIHGLDTQIHGLAIQTHGLDIHIHGLGIEIYGFGTCGGRPEVALPGLGGDGPGGPRLAGSRALKTTVWHSLDAALTGSRSYFGLPVPSEK